MRCITGIPDRKQDWSTQNEKPATKPVSLNVTSACEEFYSDPDYFQSDCDKPMYISWMHYVNSVRNGTVTGFIIEISATEAILFRVNVSRAREYFLTKEFPENEVVHYNLLECLIANPTMGPTPRVWILGARDT
uniref:uncharacterized protein LOC113475608 n=1 Tax=Ciona intestinalis TaxID=7719 RepID=UPI000EF4FBBE|nr:uncharacterized protein LOC113475608 [Ciona intestinalis]|eukprot:XP_026695756.1 uncharacterized protein LOC113475608 [Ciona intestinalis]